MSLFRMWRRSSRLSNIAVSLSLFAVVGILYFYTTLTPAAVPSGGAGGPGGAGGGAGAGPNKINSLPLLDASHQVDKRTNDKSPISKSQQDKHPQENVRKNRPISNSINDVTSRPGLSKGGVSIDSKNDVITDDDKRARLLRDQLRQNMADPKYLHKQEAIDSQNSLLKDRGRSHGLGLGSRDPHDPLNQLIDKMTKQDKEGINFAELLENVHQKKMIFSKNKEIGLKKKKTLIEDERVSRDSQRVGQRRKMKASSSQRDDGGARRGGILGAFDVDSYLNQQRIREGEGDKMKRFQFNQVVSDATPPDRHLTDVRNSKCKNSPDQYLPNLPRTTVIICFTNEARSALLRTIVSVLNRSPPEYIEEILLVDDYSDNAFDGSLLIAIPKVRLIRMDSRQGLIRSRIYGSREARGSVLLFLDSHCEVVTGWLEPLLSRIKTNRSIIVSPVIDIIDKETMAFSTASSSVRGGFDINLHFKWDYITPAEVQARTSVIAPIKTPAIAGGLFAVDKEWFHHIGDYDDQMDIWGAENVELSLRVWTCGGSMEIIPCSHVGHIFRSAIPYSFGPGGTYHNTVSKNLRRTVEVWLDEYKIYYYEKNSYSLNIPYGDISERQALRERLQCKSFKWFINNIYPQFEAPPVQDFTYGLLMNRGGVCLDSVVSFYNSMVEIRPCTSTFRGLEDSQAWALLTGGGIKHSSLCLTLNLNKVVLTSCSTKDNAAQDFQLLPSGLIWHKPGSKCLSSQIFSPSYLRMVDCDINSPAPELTWHFQTS